MIQVIIIKDNLIETITAFTSPDKAKKYFTSICLDYGANKDNIKSHIEDGYYMWMNGTVCLTWPYSINETLYETARQLKSDKGENPEYDRALVELCTYATGGNESNLKNIAISLGIELCP